MKTNSNQKKSIADEFLNAPINDQRLINRLILTATRFDEGPEKSIPDACRNWAETSAAYDFFANDKVTPAAILSSHHENTIERLKRYPFALLIQDTTKLDFSTHKSTKGLASYSTDPHSIGLLMHSVLAVSQLGFRSDCYIKTSGLVKIIPMENVTCAMNFRLKPKKASNG